MMLAPALAKSGTRRSTGFTIRCTSSGTLDVRPDRLAHQRADGEVGDVMVVHHVEVDQVGARALDRAHFLAQAREVGGKDARRDAERHGRAEFTMRAVAQEKQLRGRVVSAATQYLAEQSDEAAGRVRVRLHDHASATPAPSPRSSSAGTGSSPTRKGWCRKCAASAWSASSRCSQPGRELRVHERRVHRHAGGHDARQLPDGGRRTARASRRRSRSSRCRCRASCTDRRHFRFSRPGPPDDEGQQAEHQPRFRDR